MFITKTKIFFHDCDPAGILFYANVYKLAHSAYESFMINLETKRNYFSDEDLILPIIHSNADYYLPLKQGNEVEISIKVNQLKKSSFELIYLFFLDKKKAAEVKTIHVCIKRKVFEKTQLPEELFNKLKSYLV